MTELLSVRRAPPVLDRRTACLNRSLVREAIQVSPIPQEKSHRQFALVLELTNFLSSGKIGRVCAMMEIRGW
jgi:hypothetical protein